MLILAASGSDVTPLATEAPKRLEPRTIVIHEDSVSRLVNTIDASSKEANIGRVWVSTVRRYWCGVILSCGPGASLPHCM